MLFEAETYNMAAADSTQGLVYKTYSTDVSSISPCFRNYDDLGERRITPSTTGTGTPVASEKKSASHLLGRSIDGASIPLVAPPSRMLSGDNAILLSEPLAYIEVLGYGGDRSTNESHDSSSPSAGDVHVGLNRCQIQPPGVVAPAGGVLLGELTFLS
jgi:hypothetical protein